MLNNNLEIPLDPIHTKQPNLPKEYYNKNSYQGLFQIVFSYALYTFVLWGICNTVFPYSLVYYCLVGIIGYRFTIIIHDCSHKTLFEKGWQNSIVGWITSGCIFVSFPLFTKLHWEHHLYFRKSRDPQGTDYNEIIPGKNNILLHLIEPLFFVNFFQKAVIFLTQKHSDIDEEKTASKIINEKVSLYTKYGPLVNIAIIQIIIFYSITQLELYYKYFFYMGSLISIGLFLSRVRGYLEHGNLKSNQTELPIARTHLSNSIEKFILSPLNFNYHNEHHRWPQVPFFRLPGLHKKTMKNKLKKHEYSSSFVKSLKSVLLKSRAE